MANIKITQLPGLSVLTGTNQFPVVSSGVTFNVTANVMQTFMANVPGAITVNSTNQSVAIVNGGSNGVGNIGASGSTFNTVFARSTSAQYADLAEYYRGDREYPAGTVVSFGGSAEVTVSARDADLAVAGVVSAQPAYVMNAGLQSESQSPVLVALQGRVACQVKGPVRKGDVMVSTGDGTARSESNPRAGTIIGKSLENFDGEHGFIEIVVGRT
jgi:hypothetical protein